MAVKHFKSWIVQQLIFFFFKCFFLCSPPGADPISEGAFVGERCGGENAAHGTDESI